MKHKISFILPPLVQPNSPYPSMIHLASYLSEKGYECESYDLSIKTLLRIFSFDGLELIFSNAVIGKKSDNRIKKIIDCKDHYKKVIGTVIYYLQGRDENLAYKILQKNYLPKQVFFQPIPQLDSYFGKQSLSDKARYYASLLIDDLTIFIQQTVSPDFGLSRYAEKVSMEEISDSDIIERYNKKGLVDKIMFEELDAYIKNAKPNIVGLSVPFAGNYLAAKLCGYHIKKKYPDKKVIMGGGFVSCYLREVTDSKQFEFVDYIVFDKGEIPVLQIIQEIEEEQKRVINRVRSVCNSENVSMEYTQEDKHADFTQINYSGINKDDYFSVVEVLNQMHQLWTTGYWNKITLAEGCYWHRCRFCDTKLPYIRDFQAKQVESVICKIKEYINLTGSKSFHFTDEAMPPKHIKELCKRLLEERIEIVWWGNIRFEKSFDRELCELMSKAGCIAVSGGLEVGNVRMLQVVDKGIELDDTIRVLDNFKKAKIYVHSYLIYGLPTQTEKEVVESLEIVRQLFQNKLLKSAFWHQFALTKHSEFYENRAVYGLELKVKAEEVKYEADYKNLQGINYDKYSFGLRKAMYNYIYGIGTDWSIQEWFDFRIPKVSIPINYVKKLTVS